MSRTARERGRQWIVAVLRTLAETEWVQITNIEWYTSANGELLVVLTPQGRVSCRFREADLAQLLANDDVRTAVECRLAQLIAERH